jgi:pimeloyl-ACP methyl ester carboxylesterase
MLRRTLLAVAALTVIQPVVLSNAQEETPVLTPVESGYAAVNGVEIHYETFGSGRPLVLLHGGLMAGESFAPIIPILAEDHEVIAVDLQGHGRTPPFERPMTWSNLAADIAGLIRHLGYDKADLLGYSLGGLVALRTAIDHPEAVDRLVVVSIPYAFSGWHDYNQQGMRALSASMAEETMQSPMYELYEKLSPDPSQWGTTLDQTGALTGGDFDWSDDIPAIASPTLLVYGDYDAVRIAHSTAFFELLGGGQADGGWAGENMTPNRLAILQGTTHYNMNSDPRMAVEALRFLSGE